MRLTLLGRTAGETARVLHDVRIPKGYAIIKTIPGETPILSGSVELSGLCIS